MIERQILCSAIRLICVSWLLGVLPVLVLGTESAIANSDQSVSLKVFVGNSDTPLATAHVQIYEGNKRIKEERTGREGVVEFAGLVQQRSYEIHVYLEGYVTTTVSVDILKEKNEVLIIMESNDSTKNLE